MAKKLDSSKHLFETFSPAQSMPDGYYSEDKANTNLRRFVEEHAKPYDPEKDDYSTPIFGDSILATKATAIYNMPTYWSKKPHDAIRQYICHYTKPGDIVLDPFSGSGGHAWACLSKGVRRSPSTEAQSLLS